MKKPSGLWPVDTRKHTPKKAEQARMSSLRRLGIHKVCLRRRALTSHLLRHFWCCAVLKLRFFVPARTKLQSILSYSQDFGRRRGEKDRFKTVCFLMSVGLTSGDLITYILYSLSLLHASDGHPNHACEICCSENTDTCYHCCALLSNFRP